MNKLTLITGSSRGIGRDMAIQVAKGGDDVVITYHSNRTAGESVAEEITQLGQKAYLLQLDTRDPQAFDSFFENLKKQLETDGRPLGIDHLINNAGTGEYASIQDTTEQQLIEMFDVHFKGIFLFTQKALPIINAGGSIINISSGLTRFSFPGSSAYASMKGAIEVFTRYLAKELGDRQIRANTIAPGAIATDFGGGTNRDNEQKRKIIASLTSLGRVGEASDIGAVAAFLCSEAAGWVNGQRIEVSGGMLV